MKLSISKLEDMMAGDTVVIDTTPGIKYRVLEKGKAISGGLFNLKLKNGLRISIKLEDPTPGFFFSLAEVMDKKKGVCELLYVNGKIGAYTHD